jgi:ribonucleoside-diphosphate reductase alpha chain
MKGNDFVSLEQGSLKIISINKKEPVATYDIEVEGHHEYLLDNGIVSHNSAVVSNATNGIEPPRGFLSVKKSKKGTLKQIVPSYSSLKNHYTLLWDMPDMTGYINICAVMQKFIDQSISANTSYDASKWENSKIPMSVFARDILYGYKMGIKNWYYHNTNDGKKEDEDVEIKPEVLVEKTDDGDDEVCEACTI